MILDILHFVAWKLEEYYWNKKENIVFDSFNVRFMIIHFNIVRKWLKLFARANFQPFGATFRVLTGYYWLTFGWPLFTKDIERISVDNWKSDKLTQLKNRKTIQRFFIIKVNIQKYDWIYFPYFCTFCTTKDLFECLYWIIFIPYSSYNLLRICNKHWSGP